HVANTIGARRLRRSAVRRAEGWGRIQPASPGRWPCGLKAALRMDFARAIANCMSRTRSERGVYAAALSGGARRWKIQPHPASPRFCGLKAPEGRVPNGFRSRYRKPTCRKYDRGARGAVAESTRRSWAGGLFG